MYEFDSLINNVVEKKIEVVTVAKPYEDLKKIFNYEQMNDGGSAVRLNIEASHTSAARNFTRSDVDPTGGSETYVEARWDNVYTEVPMEISRIDINEAVGRGEFMVESLFTKAYKVALVDLNNKIFDNIYARIQADLLNSGTYSDAALVRATYPTALTVHNDVTATPLTYGLVRSCRSNTVNGKEVGDIASGYVWMIEQTAWDTLEPQLQLLNTWIASPGDAMSPGGYAPIGSISGVPTYTPNGMTDGDVFFLRREDIHMRENMARITEEVQSGRFTRKWIIRIGLTPWVENCRLHGMMTNKT
jgi:hypothetical protein